MTRESLIEKLDKATDKAVTVALVRGIPLPVSNKSTLIGNILVEKNIKGLYNVITLDGKELFKDIVVFDVAVIIAQRYNSGEMSTIKKVLMLEEKYAKYHADMVNYLHCLKAARKRHDYERMAILEDKFQSSEIYAKDIRDSISVFKRTK